MKILWTLFVSGWMLAGQAIAQAPSLDSDKPIDITADELEVRQNEKQAIFKGNVIAKQGSITMQSARMTVFYDGADTANSSQSSEGVAGGTSISKIEADGGVFFASKTETARGSKAVYDVNAEQIRMSGDVTLTREKSVVKGSGLVYNLKTGRSVLSSAKQTGQGSGRVRGLFVPSDKNEQ